MSLFNNSKTTKVKKMKKPKRNISAFHIFSKEMHLLLNQSPEKISPNRRMALISEQWANLSPVDKSHYTEKAKLDKWRYLNELNSFYSSEDVTVENNPRRKPKKFGNAFTYYLREKKPELQHANPGLPMSDIMSLVAKTWRELPKAAKQKYVDASNQDKQRYHREVCEMKKVAQASKNGEKKCARKKAKILERTRINLIECSAEFFKREFEELEANYLQSQIEDPKIEEEVDDSRSSLKQEDAFMRNQSFESIILPKLEYTFSGHKALTSEPMQSNRNCLMSQDIFPRDFFNSEVKSSALVCKTPELINEAPKLPSKRELLPDDRGDKGKTRTYLNSVLTNTLNSEMTFSEFIGADLSLTMEDSFDM